MPMCSARPRSSISACGTPHVPDFNAMLARVEALGGLIAINHPNLPNGEVCMGCGWIVPDTDYSRVQAVEI